jgi:hypothetical protein
MNQQKVIITHTGYAERNTYCQYFFGFGYLHCCRQTYEWDCYWDAFKVDIEKGLVTTVIKGTNKELSG